MSRCLAALTAPLASSARCFSEAGSGWRAASCCAACNATVAASASGAIRDNSSTIAASRACATSACNWSAWVDDLSLLLETSASRWRCRACAWLAAASRSACWAACELIRARSASPRACSKSAFRLRSRLCCCRRIVAALFVPAPIV
jgi:hypothetical protein